MSTTDPMSGVDKDSSPISLSQCYQKTVSASALPGEAYSSAAIAADSQQAASSVPRGPARVADLR